ncbi:stac, putative [Ixodes scapularis]|uniref:Stac, putative n=1 Tax=Ixodes scapularis TaxID=6945 RepID=B7P7F6_IXOSC|nr:stac, putative [Ixodes scapularis]|eukprot:XP_002410121.1 stac, putative [Ixodes scapularis]
MVVDRLASLSVAARAESLKQDIGQLETQVRQLQETLDALLRLQQRSLESSLYNKANELQEDISLKRFDLHVAQIHLAAVKAQEVEAVSEEKNCRDRKATTPALPVTGTIKNKWLKAFRSLKTGTSSGGHVRQGLKCKLCKYNVHNECQEKAGRCQPKPRLLRRQRSASEIETKIIPAEPEEERPVTVATGIPDAVDPIYQLLKQAGDLGGGGRRGEKEGSLAPRLSGGGGESSSITSSVASLQQRRPRSNASSSASSSSSHMLTVSSHQHHPSSSAPQSPVHGRRQLLSTKAVRMSSVDLPDDNEKSLSSASTSPCPSPGKCMGRSGFFPSKYVAKLHSGERALQVVHSIQVLDGHEPVKLLRDQIVIQVGDEIEGKVLVRTGLGDKALPCPLKYLQEVTERRKARLRLHTTCLFIHYTNETVYK